MNVETHVIQNGNLVMEHVAMVPQYVELLHVFQMVLLHIGNVEMSASLFVQLVMEHVLRDGTFVEITPVFFLNKRILIMTAMEAVIFCINPVMGHVSQMVKWLVMVLVLMKTL